MSKFSLSLVAASLLIAPAAHAAEDTSFTHDGVTYSYTTEVKGNEKIVRGTAYAGNVPFELHIRKKTVTGTFNNRPVDFSVSEVKQITAGSAN